VSADGEIRATHASGGFLKSPVKLNGKLITDVNHYTFYKC